MSHLIPLPAVTAVTDAARTTSFPSGATAGHGAIVSFAVSLHDAMAAGRRRHRTLIAAAGRWALAQGVPLPVDHVALWGDTAEEVGRLGDPAGLTGPWRASHMPDFLATIAARCTLAGCLPPADLAESLWHLYGFLAATGRLHPAGDSLLELRAAVVVFAGFDRLRPLEPPPPEPTAA